MVSAQGPSAAGVAGPRHGAFEPENRPRSPETIPITLEAMTYGRHAADEGWAVRPSTASPQRSPQAPVGTAAGATVPNGRARWRAARGTALRLATWLTGRSA